MSLRFPIKGIFFDAGWTLFRPVNAEWFMNNKVTQFVDPHAFSAIPQAKKASAFGKALQFLDDNHLIMTLEAELEQFKAFYSIISDGLPELALAKEQIDEIAYSKVFDMGNYVFFEDTRPTLEALKGKYKLGIISDTWPSIENILKSGNIDCCFHVRTFSCYLGTFKPDERMYLHALGQMGLPPEQTLFIDDSEENLDGAAKCGIQPVLITTNPNTKISGRHTCINRLSQLTGMLTQVS